MKTIYINCSPKKKLSASGYLISVQKLLTPGSARVFQLRHSNGGGEILKALEDADNVVFAMPLYVDAVPSHVLGFLKRMENWCLEHRKHLTVWSITNNGFIEGRQSEPVLRILENFCSRADLHYGGGIGIGGGVMLNVSRILLLVSTALLLINMIASGLQHGDFFPISAVKDYGHEVLNFLFFNCGVLYYQTRMAFSMESSKILGRKYTRIMVPSFLFIPAADLFFLIVSIFQGGIFRKWLSPR